MSVDCVFSEVNGWVLVVHSKNPPSVEEWAALLEFYKTSPLALKGVLVYTEGGALSAFQRKQLRDVFTTGGRELPATAILTDSTLVRLGITAFGLFIRGKIRAFELHNPAEALRYLGVPAHEYAVILREVRGLARQINARTPISYHVG